jgi:hypothetical protein
VDCDDVADDVQHFADDVQHFIEQIFLATPLPDVARPADEEWSSSALSPPSAKWDFLKE